MPTTASGLWYPASTDDVRVWEDMEALAESVQAVFDRRGRIATTTRIASSTGVTSETVVDSVTASLVAGITYSVTWNPGVDSTVAGDTLLVRLRQDGIAGTQMQRSRVEIPATGGAGTRYIETLYAEFTAAATGSKTFVGTIQRLSGSGSVSVECTDATEPVYLRVDYVSGEPS